MKNKLFLLLLFLSACVPVSVGSGQLVVDSTPTAIIVPTATSTPKAETWQVCGGNVNVRSVPAPRDGVIGWLMAGDSVIVYKWVDGWAMIGGGWVNGRYLCHE